MTQMIKSSRRWMHVPICAEVFWQPLSLSRPHQCARMPVEMSQSNCHKAARLFHHPLQRLFFFFFFFTRKQNIVTSRDSKNACCRYGKLQSDTTAADLALPKDRVPGKA